MKRKILALVLALAMFMPVLSAAPASASGTVSVHASTHPFGQGGTIEISGSLNSVSVSSSATTSATLELSPHTSVALIATAHSGWTFSGWYEGGSHVSSSTTHSFHLGAHGRSFQARFVQTGGSAGIFTVAVHPNPPAGGWARVIRHGQESTSHTFNHHESATVQATANSGWTFSGWYEGGSRVHDHATWHFTPTFSRTLEARFTQGGLVGDGFWRVTATAQPSHGGSVTGAGTFSPTHGVSTTLEATPNSGWFFTGWYNENNVRQTSNRTMNVTPGTPPADRRFEARFSQTPPIVHITATAAPAGSGTVTGGGQVQGGTTAQMRATPATGWVFQGWYEGGARVSSNANWNFTANADRTLEARFLRRHSIIVNRTGTGAAGGGGTFETGATVTLTATVTNVQWQFAGWYENNVRLSSNTTWSFTASEDRTIEARFARPQATLELTAAQGGTVTGGGTFNRGTNRTIRAVPDSGWNFAGWYESGARVHANATWTFNVNEDRTLEARFTRAESVITATAAEGGTVTGGGTFEAGAAVTLTAAPNDGWVFDGWFQGGARVSSNAFFSFSADTNMTLEARFVRQPVLTLSAVPAQGGTVAGGGRFNPGAAATLTAAPSVGWTFDGWFQGGVRVSTDASLNMAMSVDTALEARFSPPATPLTPPPVSQGLHRQGEVIGNVLNTNIRVFIDGVEIQGYNVNGWTYVVAEDLRAYGMAVRWNAEARTLGVTRGASTRRPQPVPTNLERQGSIAFPYIYTDIATSIGPRWVNSYNIGGRTVVRVDDVAEAFGSIRWDGANRRLYITLD